MLQQGERVHTVVFSGEPRGRRSRNDGRVRDALVHMYGCPYCYPPSQRIERVCPVCASVLPEEGYLVARMFVREGRKHVHVLGCTECRGERRSDTIRNSG